MHKISTYFLVLFMLIACLAAHAGDNTARQLVDHLYVATGQIPIRDCIVDAECSDNTSEQGSGNLTLTSKDKLFFKAPNKLRIESLTIAPGDSTDQTLKIIIRDGVNAWMYVSQGQYPVKKKADEPSATLSLPFNIQKYPQDSGKQYVYVGQESVDSTSSEVVRIIDPARPDEITTVWIDKERFVPVKLHIKRPASNPKDKFEEKTVLYKNIRQFPDGRWFPWQLEIYEGNVLRKLRVYKAVSINTGLQEALFKPMEKFVK